MTDQELDRLLYAHAGAARDLVLAQLPPEGELPDIPTSPRFQRRMKALIRRADRPAGPRPPCAVPARRRSSFWCAGPSPSPA